MHVFFKSTVYHYVNAFASIFTHLHGKKVLQFHEENRFLVSTIIIAHKKLLMFYQALWAVTGINGT